MRKHAVVLVDVERHQPADGGDAVERVEEQPLNVSGLRSLSDLKRHYTGATSDLDRRLADDNAGRGPHTAEGHLWQTGDIFSILRDEAVDV
jgi:hypothetical protein